MNRRQKKLLKSQVFNLSEQLKVALDTKKETKQPCSQRQERDIIQNILEERAEFFAQRVIVGDIKSFSARVGGIKQITQFDCKYGLDMTIDNLNSFLDFCAIHGFIPMIDKILIDGKDISQLKEVFSLFEFALFENDPLIANILANEINKLEFAFQGPAREVLSYIQQISTYTTSTYQYLLGDKLQKIRNEGTLSENIFAEVALRIENQIREKVWIMSSYMKLAGYDEDTLEKTDMHFVLKKTPQQSYLSVPTQFTIGANGGLRNKKEKIEEYLLREVNNWTSTPENFLVLAVNGEFKKNISNPNFWNTLNTEYKQRLTSPEEREKSVGKKFPLFINTLDQKIIQPAEVLYIALHLLYKKYDFKNTTKASYLKACEKKGKIDKTNHNEINGILLSDIMIDEVEIARIKNGHPNAHTLLKHEYHISYQGEKMGTIIVYGL